MKLKHSDKSEFNQIEITRRIIVNEQAHTFGILNLGEELGDYGLSWGSPTITPEIERSTDKLILWIGVDERLAAIDLQDGHIRLVMPLFSPLFQILVVEDITVILTELEVIIFNSDCSIRCYRGLPNLSESISFNGSDFVIKMFDTTNLILSSTGKIKELQLSKSP